MNTEDKIIRDRIAEKLFYDLIAPRLSKYIESDPDISRRHINDDLEAISDSAATEAFIIATKFIDQKGWVNDHDS